LSSILVHIKVSPEDLNNIELHKKLIQEKSNHDFKSIVLRKRSIDARQRKIFYQLQYEIFIKKYNEKVYNPNFNDVSKCFHCVHIIGAGPAGLFAALRCIQIGIKPIVFERGKNVRERRRDLAAINKNGIVNKESNYCFGEGGAGTYSDGKLYTRSKKKGNIPEILNLLVHHGAEKDILIDSHPHIGTNKLPNLISNIRKTILKYGGEINFGSKLTDLKFENSKLTSITINNNQSFKIDHLILATGHSARDVFKLLYSKNVKIDFKDFAVGVRIEHPQSEIDKLMYNKVNRGEYLPPASYSLVYNNGERSVYSFCMCPGGIIAPCATEEEEIVTNGWSPSKRNNPYANSGIVVEVKWSDLKDFHQFGPLAGVEFQKSIEKKAWEIASNGQVLPVQLLDKFLQKKSKSIFPPSSYFPGFIEADLSKVFPSFIYNTLKEGFLNFDKKLKGFISPNALLHAPETRTSSPVRIPRNKNFHHPDFFSLYPCGEGAGYAGGIMSAAIDGIRCVDAISNVIKN
tara:strand:- start:3916 stop:5463 length:1548 start_codon:yes stop_codon:yes gene_type:complete